MKRRTTLESGIYKDVYGLAACVTVRGQRREKRFAPDTPLSILRQWRKATARVLEAYAPPSRRGTLAQDVDRYLALVRGLASWRAQRAGLAAWCARYGTWRRWELGPTEVHLTRQTWLAAGVAPGTINHRTATLQRLYRVLDGRPGYPPPLTPADGLKALPVARTAKSPVDPALVVAVVARLAELAVQARTPARQTRLLQWRARVMVLATTGVRPVELGRAEPGDLHLDADPPYWTVRDAKGGRRLSSVPLNGDMVAAWEAFVAAQAWGPFDSSDLGVALRQAGWPVGLRVYRLRASVGIALSTQGQDLADVAGWLGHSRIQTTRDAYVPVLAPRMVAASQALEGRFGWGVVVPFRAPASGRRVAGSRGTPASD